MWRFVVIFAVALVVATTTGLLPEAAEDDVARTDECDGKQCPPTCPTCVCAWHSLKSAPTAIVAMTVLELTSAAAELPPPAGRAGRTVPPPTLRPPIV